MMITESTQEEVESLLRVMRHKFSENISKYKHERFSSAKELANQEIQALLTNNNKDRFWTKKESDKKIGSLWIQERDNDIMLVYIYVEEAFRGQGHGKELMEYLDCHFAKSAKVKIILHVFFENRSAVKLYKKCGFSEQSIIMSKQKSTVE